MSVQKIHGALVLGEVSDQPEDRGQRAEVDDSAAAAAGSACPLMLPFSLRKAITEPEKVIAPIATPSPISTRLTGRIAPDASTIPNADGIEEGRRADQHRRHADQAVEGRDQLRHRGHLDAPRGDQADRRRRSRWRRRSRRARRCRGSPAWSRPRSPCRPCRARLPRWLLAGLDRPRSARMKQTPAIR